MLRKITAKRTTLYCSACGHTRAVAWTDRRGRRASRRNSFCLDCLRDAAEKGEFGWTDWFIKEAKEFMEECEYVRGPNLKMNVKEIRTLLSGSPDQLREMGCPYAHHEGDRTGSPLHHPEVMPPPTE